MECRLSQLPLRSGRREHGAQRDPRRAARGGHLRQDREIVSSCSVGRRRGRARSRATAALPLPRGRAFGRRRRSLSVARSRTQPHLTRRFTLPSSDPEVARREGRQGLRLCRIANPFPASERGIGFGGETTRQETKRNKTPSRGRVQRRTACLIVPVFGLALAPYWRSAGCRARHRARALGAALDRYVCRH